jgi:hypothetical protein
LFYFCRQIITVLPSSFGIQFPSVTTKLYHALSFVNFTSLRIGDPQCYAPRRLDYIDKLVIQTVAPIVIICIVFVVAVIHVADVVRRLSRHKRKLKSELSAVVGRYLSIFFLIVYLVLPGVTTTIAGIIPSVNVDPDGLFPGKNLRYMRNDPAISITSDRYKFGIGWASAMFLVYPIGVPCLYLFVLYINKDKIKAKDGHPSVSASLTSQPSKRTVDGAEDSKSVVETVREYVTPEAISFLHGAYEGQFWYWELLETSRRLFLTALLSIVSAGNN